MSRVKRLICTCCGRYTKGRQWFNQDKGSGLCPSCVESCKKSHTEESFVSTYGMNGIHYNIEAAS